MSNPTTTSQWSIRAKDGLDGLTFHENVPIPPLGPNDCLVKVAAVSLNYRDVALPTGKYPLYGSPKIVPTSDGAGTVIAVGKDVKLHKPGDPVCTLFTQAHQTGRFEHWYVVAHGLQLLSRAN
jgi:NADPH:quinone reductase-like Zn-dependent oxidoreductase